MTTYAVAVAVVGFILLVVGLLLAIAAHRRYRP